MNAKRTIIAVLLGGLLVGPSGFEAIASDTEKEVRLPGQGELEYRLTTSGTHREMFVDETTRRRSNGQTVYLNQWGNKLKKTGNNWVNFTPNNGQLPEQPMAVGLTWEHRYRVENEEEIYWRRRECRVADRDAITVEAGTFRKAWKVECTNQREDRALPMHEATWYSNRGRVLLRHKEWWHGSDPGSFGAELVDLSAKLEKMIE